MKVCVRPQAADVPLDEELDEAEDAEDGDDVEAAGFESDPDEDDVLEAEPDVFADDVADVLLDEEPRLSFR